MTISDLKTGMTVTCRNGNRYIVMRDTLFYGEEKDILFRPGGFWMSLSEYDNDFNVKPEAADDFGVERREDIDRGFDIVEVQQAESVAFIGHKKGLFNKVLWRRD